MTSDERVASVGLEIPPVLPPAGTYVNCVRTGSLLVLGGHIPWASPDRLVLGKLGDDLSVDEGRDAARLAALSALRTIIDELGTLDAVRQLVMVRGVVNSTLEFTGHTQVIDGASDLFVEVFGDRGKHARLAVGVSSLPVNLALEIELLIEIDPAAVRVAPAQETEAA